MTDKTTATPETDAMGAAIGSRVQAVVLPDAYGSRVDVCAEITRLVDSAFFTGQRATTEPLASFRHIIEQREWLLDIIRQNGKDETQHDG